VPSSSCTIDFFSDIVVVWMLRFVLILQMSVNCPEDPVTVLALRTPVVTFLSYICRSVLQGKLRQLHALMPSLGACNAIDGSLLPAIGVLLLLMAKGSVAVNNFVRARLDDDARQEIRASPLFQEYELVSGPPDATSGARGACVGKEGLGNLPYEGRPCHLSRMPILGGDQGSLAFGPTLCAPCLSFATKVAFLQRELKSVELLRERPALIPQYMYVAQCLHCAEMSSLDDYGLTSRCVVDNLLVLAESQCEIWQPQARSWLDIVACLQKSQVIHASSDRSRVLCSVLDCTFGEESSTGEGLKSIGKAMNAQAKVQLLELWRTVKRALQGRTFALQPDLVWLASVAANVADARAVQLWGRSEGESYL
jgi:hypothetical protein